MLTFKTFIRVALPFPFLVLLVLSLSCEKPSQLPTCDKVLKQFQNPSAEFRSAPLWVWNDKMTEQEIETHLKELKSQGMGGVFIHPRPGLITPYLSEEWLSLCRFAVKKGKALGMKVWLYDENSYPSGFAGGHVPAEMPESVGKGLRLTRTNQLPESFTQKPVVVLKATSSGFEDITKRLAAETNAAGDYYVFDLEEARKSSWFGGFSYVDLMRKEVTEKFLDLTLGAYKKAIGKEFGKTVPGIFTDEPHIRPVGGRDRTNWTPALFDEFEKCWGYDLKVKLPSLFDEVGDWRKVRHNYRHVLNDLFVEGWAKPYFDYCEKNDLLMTGHYWEHEWPRPHGVPDNMAMYAWMQMPGIDCLMNEFKLDPHAQFGNARAVKELASVANQMGRSRTLCEAYGASGWDLTFEDQKRIGDWLYVLGVNFLNQHLSYITIKGARKRDHPPSFSYHAPWWESYHIMADYFARLSVALSAGKQSNNILVIEPNTSAWMYYSPNESSERLDEIGNEFQDFVSKLEKFQVEYDLGSESVIELNGIVTEGRFEVGERAYDLLVLPPGLENLNTKTVKLMKTFLTQGGKIVSFVEVPDFIDGVKSSNLVKLTEDYAHQWVNAGSNWDIVHLSKIGRSDLTFASPNDIGGMVFHHQRRLQDGKLIFIINTDKEKNASGQFTVTGKSVEEWNLHTGKAIPYPSKNINGTLQVEFEIDPVGSLFLCVKETGKETEMATPSRERLKQKRADSRVVVKRVSTNMLILDYCDLKIDGKVESGLYFYDAQRKTFQHHGLDVNPWDHAVQYKTNILDQDKFDPNSGFEATYKFKVASGTAVETLELVVERPELFKVKVNGNAVENIEGSSWLDRSFGVYSIGEHVVAGENRVTFTSSPFTIHSELEPIYILGDFSLTSEQQGWNIIPAAKMKLGSWNSQGMPFSFGPVSYSKTFSIGLINPPQRRYYLELGEWLGALAKVWVNGELSGHIISPPYRIEITEKIKPGKNSISVVVYGTLKNLLGPHHGQPPHGRAWPGMFRKGAEGGQPSGGEYDVIEYGLFEDFKVLN